MTENLNIQASNSARIDFDETSIRQHAIAMQKIRIDKRDRHDEGTLDGNVQAMSAALMLGCDIPADDVEASFVSQGIDQKNAEKIVDLASGGPSMSLHRLTSDICASLGENLGVRESPMSAWQSAVQHSKQHMPNVMASATNLVSLSSVLVQTVNRILLLPPQEQQPASDQMCRPYSVPDFRANILLKPIQPELHEIGQNGEIKNDGPPMTIKEMPDKSFKLTCFGMQSGFTRKDIINDTAIGLVSEMVTAARIAAYSCLDREFFKMLSGLDSGTAGTYWLTADSVADRRRANSFTGTGTGFDLDFYNQLATTLRKQTAQNVSQTVKSQRASILLVPAEMEVSARAVLKQVFSGMNVSEIPRLVVSDWLTHSAITDDPATAAKTAYLMTDRDAGAFGCAFLNEIETPTVSLQDMVLSSWNWAFRVIFDFKHLPGDPTCCAKGVTA